MANSFIQFVLAYLIVLIPTQLVTHFVALYFDIPTKFTFFKLSFPIPDHSYLWTSNSVAAIYVTGPVIALFIAFFAIRYFMLFAAKKSIQTNLLFIWIYAHCMNVFFGGLTIGIPLIKGFGYVPSWLYASNELTFILILLSLLVLFGNGFILRGPFISLYYNNRYFNSPFHSLIFKIFIVFIPFIAANVLFYLMKFPDNSIYERLTGLTMIVQLVGIIPYTPVYQPEEFEFKPVKFAYKWLLILIVLFMLFVLWRTIHNHLIYQIPESSTTNLIFTLWKYC